MFVKVCDIMKLTNFILEVLMKKHLDILNNEVEHLKKDKNIHSIILTGSVAYDMANEDSDLDLLVLCDEDSFENKYIDNILVEIHFQRYQTLKKKLKTNPMEVYKYLYSKVIFDNGEYAKLHTIAKELYDNYKTPDKERENISYWLSSTKSKLTSALNHNDYTRASYLVATNTWKLLEGIYAINNKPIPPSSLVFNKHQSLKLPIDNWFEKLFDENTLTRANTMIEIIDIICIKPQ
jgi:predicted nucleotidyltransferase